MSKYVYKDTNKNFYLFEYRRNSIIRKKMEDNKFQGDEIIASNVRDGFSVNIGSNSQIIIFCQDQDYNVLMVSENNGLFTSQVFLRNTTNEKVIFNCILNNEKLCVLYNSENKIFLQTIENNKFNNAIELDTLSPIRRTNFDFVKYDNDALVFYKNNENTGKLGYRNVSTNGCSEFNLVHKTNYEIIDVSTLLVDDSLFMTYVVKSSFSYQLIFRKSENGILSESTILSEGQNIDNIVLFYSDKLYVFFTSRDGLYYITSEDFGENFSKPKKYNDGRVDFVKAKYITNTISDMVCNDIYVSKMGPKQIRVLPEIYENFYNDIIYEKIIEEKQPIKQQPERVIQDMNTSNNMYYENLADLADADFYKILLDKKREKDMLKKQYKNDNYTDDELMRLKKENESLKRTLSKFVK